MLAQSIAYPVHIIFLPPQIQEGLLSVIGERMSNKSHVVRKPYFCVCENKGADQLRSNCEADQRLCFRYSDSTIPLLLTSKISSF